MERLHIEISTLEISTSLDSFQPVEEDIIFPAVNGFNSTVDAVFKDLGMWEIVA